MKAGDNVQLPRYRGKRHKVLLVGRFRGRRAVAVCRRWTAKERPYWIYLSEPTTRDPEGTTTT